MIDDPRTDDEQDEAYSDIEDAEEVSDETQTSQLDDSLQDLQNLMGGLAARLLGLRAARKLEIDPEKPVISPEVDKAIEGLGDSVGRFLSQAGDEIRKAAGVKDAQPGAEAPAGGDAAGDKAAGDKAAEDPDLEGWSPLVIGARAFAESVGSVAAELMEKANQKAGPRGEE